MTSLVSTIQFAIQPPFMTGPGMPLYAELHGESLAQRAVQHRKKVIESPWVQGSFVVRSVKDQVTEVISLWITGEPGGPSDAGRSVQDLLTERVEQITDCFDQLEYEIAITMGNVREVWTCSTADYTITTEQAYLEAQTVLIRAQVPRQPSVVRTIE